MNPITMITLLRVGQISEKYSETMLPIFSLSQVIEIFWYRMDSIELRHYLHV
jgi:hypothetical protein